jgi:hypothetical protein
VTSADLRLVRIRRVVRLPDAAPLLLPSDSNDAWRIGDVILRICWRGDRDRFLREAAVLAVLPPEVHGPRLLDAGRTGDLAWQLTHAMAGVPLTHAWRTLTEPQRREAVQQLGTCLAALHTHPLPADVRTMLAAPRPGPHPAPSDVVGADIHPLPYHRLVRLLDPVRALPGGDPGLIDVLAERLDALARHDPFLGDTEQYGCVHGDAHLGNALWHNGSVALLDFEWVRIGPPDLDLEPFIRIDTDGVTFTPDVRAVLGWLAETHPTAFTSPDLLHRLWLYQLGSALRDIVIAAANPAGAFAALRHIVDSPDHIRRILPG